MSLSHTNCITLAEWLPVLLRWYPPANAMVVGDDDLPLQHLHTRESGQRVTIFKAGNPLKTPVQAQPPSHPVPQPVQHTASPGPAIHPWFITSHTGPTSYYRASLPAHSGLLPAEALQCCWPNIKTVEQKTVNALSLDAAVHQASSMALTPSEPLAPDWLWVNCLPALPILQGATQALQSAQVVLARVVLHSASLADAALLPLQQLLEGQGFMLTGVQPERNPHLGTAVFVRDYAAAQQAETQAKLLEAQAKLELLQKHELLAQAQKALEADLAQNRKALADAQAAHGTAQKAAQAELAQQAQAITALTQARDAEAKAKADLLQKHELLAQAQKALEADLAQNRKALADAQAAHDTAQKAAQAQLAQQAQDITALTQARDAEAKAKAELLQKHELIYLVCFLNSLCVIKKERHKDNILGERFVVGSIAEIYDGILRRTEAIMTK